MTLWIGGLLGCALFLQQEDFKVSVNVDLVVLQATVSDRAGRFAPDLTQSDFEIYEDGVRQTVRLFRHEDVPVTVGLVIDHSGSMQPKLAEVATAAQTFAKASNPEDGLFVVNFNDRLAFVSRPEDLEQAILKAPAIGMTRLYDAVIEAQERLRTSEREKKALIVISDGGDNASKQSLSEVLKNAEASPAIIYTIGIFDADDSDSKPDVLRRLARFTGGEAFFPVHLNGTVEICSQIAHDIRNQYTLGYVSTNTGHTAAFRTLRVTASAPGHGKLIVRTRSGYVAGGK
jgi:VWFA-related protein